MELKNKIVRILEEIVSAARNEWSSHEEESDGINAYTLELENLILLNSSLLLEEKRKKQLIGYKKILKDLEDDDEMFLNNNKQWVVQTSIVEGKITILEEPLIV